MNRREYLLGFSAILTASVSGCLSTDERTDSSADTTDVGGQNSDSTPEEPQVYTPGETATTSEGDLTIEGLRVQKSVIDRGGFRVLHREEGLQYLLIEADGFSSDFVPVFDGSPAEPPEQHPPTGPDSAYALGVAVERVGSADTVSVALESDTHIRWELPFSALELLRNRPRIHLRDAECVEHQGGGALHVEVENDGARDGVFRAITISPEGADIDDDISITVPQHETVRTTVQNTVTENYWDPSLDLGPVEPDQRSFGRDG